MTIAQFIQTGPAKANELFAKLSETGPGALKTRERLFDELKAELELHARLEREHLVPALRKHDETKALIPHITEDSKHIAKLMGEIDKMPKDGDDFADKVNELKRTFQQHMRDDRKELLPAVKQALSREEASAVAEAIEADKAAVEAAKRAETEARRAEERLAREAAELDAELAAQAEKQAKKTAADARKTALAAAEIGRQSIEGADEVVQNAARVVARASAGSARRFEGAVEQMKQGAEQTTQGLAAMTDYGSTLTSAMHEGVQAWMTWARESAAANVTGFQALLGCRSAPEVAAVHGRLIQEHIGLMEAAARTSGKRIEAIRARGKASAEAIAA